MCNEASTNSLTTARCQHIEVSHATDVSIAGKGIDVETTNPNDDSSLLSGEQGLALQREAVCASVAVRDQATEKRESLRFAFCDKSTELSRNDVK